MITYFITYFSHFLIGIGVGILLGDFFEKKNQNEFKLVKDFMINLLVNTTYNCIYYYSKLQIFLIQAKNQINLFIEANPNLLKIKKFINELIYYFYNPENNVEHCHGYGFCIYNYNNNNNNIVNKVIYYNDTNNVIQLNEISDIKFLLIEFNLGDKSYKIDLKTDVFNYYLVGNKFTKEFFIYYVKKYININENIDINNNEKTFVKIIDHNVNQVKVEFLLDESILLEKNNYRII
jgi:hypothetical protein